MSRPAHTTRDGRTWGVYAISAGRPANVPAMQALFAPDPITWVVPHAERHDYATAGAHAVLPVPLPAPGHYQLTTQRQAALTHALTHGAVCIQTDDDCKGFKAATGDERRPPAVEWPELRDAMLDALDGETHLVGLPPTSNAYFARGKKLTYGFVLASLHATDTNEVAWDTTLPVKEDYDFTCGHLARYGRIARLDTYVANYDHYSNRGGVVAVRTPENERDSARRLVERWPDYLRTHARRAGELSFKPQRSTKTPR